MKTKLFQRWSRSAASGICLIGILAGCAEKNPLDDVVVAPTDFKMMMWRGDVSGHFNYQEWHDFDEAMQEIKYDVMISKEASGSDAVKNAACLRIDGKTVRDVLIYGYGLKMTRLVAEREKVSGFLEINRKFKTREGDEASAQHLQGVREEQSRRLQTLDQQIEDIRSVLQRRGLSLPGASPEASPSKTESPTATKS